MSKEKAVVVPDWPERLKLKPQSAPNPLAAEFACRVKRNGTIEVLSRSGETWEVIRITENRGIAADVLARLVLEVRL